jgi:hypothetical protein
MKFNRKSYVKYLFIVIILLALIYMLVPKSLCSDSIGKRGDNTKSNDAFACIIKD